MGYGSKGSSLLNRKEKGESNAGHGGFFFCDLFCIPWEVWFVDEFFPEGNGGFGTIDLINPLMMREISLHNSINSNWRVREQSSNLELRYNMDLTSLVEPSAMYKNLENSLLDCRSKPSAMLLEIEMTALQI
jgi:hypothetical protein